MRSLVLALLLGAALLGQARADSTYDACVEAANGVMPQMGDCGGAWVDREDRRLNAAWTILMTKVDAATRASLLDEQRAWIAYKDEACDFYASGDYGQIGTMLEYPTCRAELLVQRTKELKAYGEAIEPQ